MLSCSPASLSPFPCLLPLCHGKCPSTGTVPLVPTGCLHCPCHALSPHQGALRPHAGDRGQTGPCTEDGDSWGDLPQSRNPAPAWQHAPACMDEAGPWPQQKTPACGTPQPPALSRALPRASAWASPSLLSGRAVGFSSPPPPCHAGSQGRRSPQRRCGRSLLAMETLLARSLSFPTLIFSSDRSFSK